MPESTDQVQKTEQSAEPKSIRDFVGLWQTESKGKEVTPDVQTKTDVKPAEGSAEAKTATPDDKPCTDCGKDKEPAKETRTPIEVIKHDGKEIPIYTKEDLLAYAQKGFDYTKKTQDLAKERDEVLTKSEQVNKIAKNVDEIMSTLENDKSLPVLTDAAGKPKTPEEVKTEIANKLGIELEYADEDSKRMIDYMTEQAMEVHTTKSKNTEMENIVKLIMLKEAVGGLGDIIKESRKDYPFEEHYDPDGNNQTGGQFIAILKAKHENNPNKRPLTVLTRETVKELSEMQKKSRESAPNIPPDKIDEVWLKENRPDLYKKLVTSGQDDGVADYLKTNSESPPSLQKRKVPVDVTSSGPKDFANTKEAIAAWRKNKGASA